MKYFSLFTGIGGLDIGMAEMGFECSGFSEIRKTSIEIYLNHYFTHQNYGDITKINIEELPDFDILTGGFPCQSFSLAGLRKGMSDPRGVMILYIYNILMVKQPKYFVLENVKGLLNHGGGKTYKKVHQLLAAAGYKVRVLLLNAFNYGSVQNRERLVFLGSKEDFAYRRPIIEDQSKIFRDVRDLASDLNGKFIPYQGRNAEKIEQRHIRNFELIGDYDKVGTLTTQEGCGEKLVAVKEKFRLLSPLECERIQNFPDNWTVGQSNSARYWALGNAVNCNVSRYLFKKYLKGLWY